MEVTIHQIHQHNSQINSFELMNCNGSLYLLLKQVLILMYIWAKA